MDRHITEGKSKLNFSNFEIDPHKMEEIAEEIEEDKMPLKSYRMFHKKARLDDSQKKELIEWATLEADR
jgi:hypothetical protein